MGETCAPLHLVGPSTIAGDMLHSPPHDPRQRSSFSSPASVISRDDCPLLQSNAKVLTMPFRSPDGNMVLYLYELKNVYNYIWLSVLYRFTIHTVYVDVPKWHVYPQGSWYLGSGRGPHVSYQTAQHTSGTLFCLWSFHDYADNATTPWHNHRLLFVPSLWPSQTWYIDGWNICSSGGIIYTSRYFCTGGNEMKQTRLTCQFPTGQLLRGVLIHVVWTHHTSMGGYASVAMYLLF